MEIKSAAMEVIEMQQHMESHRSTFDTHWKEIAERCLPRHDDFMQSPTRPEGEKRTDKIFDSTAVLALDRAASAIDSLITPASQTYHKLAPEDDRLINNRQIKIFLDQLNNMLFRLRYRPFANFSSQAHECWVSLMAFGTQAMFIDDLVGRGAVYKSIPMAELYIAEDANGIVDMVHRKFPMTARAAYGKWGDALPEKIVKSVEKAPLQKFEFIHCVKPNKSIEYGRKDRRGMKFSSYYVSCEGKTLLSEGGYRTMPYAVSRHVTAPREVYGRSPAMMVLADIKMLNEMEKTTIRAAHKIVDPPLLAFGDGSLTSFNSRPNAINFGTLDEQGRQLVQGMKMGSNLPIALEMTEQKRELINDAFFVTLFQILVKNPQMTATEALIRAQEKGQLLAPTVGRQESEMIGKLIEREIDIAAAYGFIPEPPQELIYNGGYKVVHTSPLARLRRADDAVAILRTLESTIPLAEHDPTVLDNFDLDKAVRELSSINGYPEALLRAPEEIAQLRAQRGEQQAQQINLENADVAATAAKNITQAAATAKSAGLPIVPEAL